MTNAAQEASDDDVNSDIDLAHTHSYQFLTFSLKKRERGRRLSGNRFRFRGAKGSLRNPPKNMPGPEFCLLSANTILTRKTGEFTKGFVSQETIATGFKYWNNNRTTHKNIERESHRSSQNDGQTSSLFLPCVFFFMRGCLIFYVFGVAGRFPVVVCVSFILFCFSGMRHTELT